jgi:hypothetical protein
MHVETLKDLLDVSKATILNIPLSFRRKVIQARWLLQYVRYGHQISPHHSAINFMVTPCINNIHHFNYQLMHTTLKNVELLKHFKISKTAPTCFGLQSSGSHNQYLAKNYTFG